MTDFHSTYFHPFFEKNNYNCRPKKLRFSTSTGDFPGLQLFIGTYECLYFCNRGSSLTICITNKCKNENKIKHNKNMAEKRKKTRQKRVKMG